MRADWRAAPGSLGSPGSSGHDKAGQWPRSRSAQPRSPQFSGRVLAAGSQPEKLLQGAPISCASWCAGFAGATRTARSALPRIPSFRSVRFDLRRAACGDRLGQPLSSPRSTLRVFSRMLLEPEVNLTPEVNPLRERYSRRILFPEIGARGEIKRAAGPGA